MNRRKVLAVKVPVLSALYRTATLRLASGLLVLYGCTCLAQSLSIVRPQTNEIVIQKGVSLYVETGISLADATALYQALPREAQTGSIPSLFKVPHFPTMFIVTASGPDSRNADYGLCLYVFQRDGTSFKRLYRSRGMADRYILRPTFFAGVGRTLVMAEIGDEEGTWGLQGFEITPASVRYLGLLDAARSDPQNPECWVNPLREATVQFVSGTYIVRVRGEVHLHPGSRTERKLPGTGWHTFVTDGKKFAYRPQ